MSRLVRVLTVGVAVLSPLASHSALSLGQAYGAGTAGLALRVATGLAAAQAVAVGMLLWNGLGRWRFVGPGVAAALLGALAVGSVRSAATGLLVAAGVSHAMLYAGLLGMFAGTLGAGRESLVTGLARRLNPTFHPGMVPYTRKVTVAWCVFFGGQLAASAVLLAVWPAAWPMFVTTVHAPLVLLMAIAEFAVRRWRWRHEHHTGLRDTVLGVRRLSRERMNGGGEGEGGRTSRTA